MNRADPGFFRRHQTLSQCITAVIMLVLVWQPFVFADELALPSTDSVAPDGEHNPVSGAMLEGQSMTIKAEVFDNIGVEKVTLFYRVIGSDGFSPIVMEKTDGDSYSVTIRGKLVVSPGIEYYIQAEDSAGNTRTFGYKFSPYIVKVTPDGVEGGGNLYPGDDLRDGDSSMALVKNGSADSDSGSSYKWLWIGLGVLAVGALAGGGGGGGGDDPPGKTDDTGSIVINGPAP